MIPNTAILDTIRLLKIVSRSQLQRLHYPCPKHWYPCDCRRGVTTICKQLSVLGFYLVPQLPRARGIKQGTLYMLHPDYEKGCRVVGNEREEQKIQMEVEEEHIEKLRMIRSKHLKHHLFTNDCYIWFRLSELKLHEITAAYEVHIKDSDDERAIPDGLFSISLAGKKALKFHIEADRGTESPSQLAKKLYRYSWFIRDWPNYRILFIAQSNWEYTAAEQVFTAARAAKIEERVWFTDYDPCAPANVLTCPVWQRCDLPGRFSLFPGLHMDDCPCFDPDPPSSLEEL